MELEAYMRGWRERAKREAARTDEARRRARHAVPVAVEVLRLHGARAIWLIGSLPRGTFEPGSDLDFLVEGLPDRAVAGAAAEASERTGLAVDILCAGRLDAQWRCYHEQHGERMDD